MRMKKMLALLLSFMLILGCVPVAMAADTDSTIFVGIGAGNPEYPAAGDELTFCVLLTNLTGVGAFEFVVNLPEGLTYVKGGCSQGNTGFKDISIDVYDGYLKVMAYGHETGYEGNLIAVDFTVVVDEDATGTLEISTSGVVLYDVLGSKLPAPAKSSAYVTIHTHTFGETWECDKDGHWHECQCGEIENKQAHEYSWKLIEKATCTDNGLEIQVCGICGFEGETRTIEAEGHKWGSDLVCTECGEVLVVGDNSHVSVKEDGTVVITTTMEDGSVVVTYKFTNGVHVDVTLSPEGEVLSIVIKILARTSAEAVKTDIPVDLRLDEIEELKNYTGTNLLVTIITNCEDPVPVEFPVEGVKPGHVVMIIDAEGNQDVVATTKMTENGVVFYCDNNTTIKVVYNAKNFSDVKANSWYSAAVEFVSAREIMNGMSANTFAPDDTTTRAQVWAMLARLSGVDAYGDNWATIAREWVMENNISDGERANDSITRQELVTMLYRFVEKKGETKSLENFSDAADVADWAKDAVEWAVGMGVMKGNADGTLNPTGKTTRAEMAQFFMNFIQNV